MTYKVEYTLRFAGTAPQAEFGTFDTIQEARAWAEGSREEGPEAADHPWQVVAVGTDEVVFDSDDV